jgi:hypothetical protein
MKTDDVKNSYSVLKQQESALEGLYCQLLLPPGLLASDTK